MNRLIVSKTHPDYLYITKDNLTYNYKFNEQYTCVEINTEFLFWLKLKHLIKLHGHSPDGKPILEDYLDMPTYAIISSAIKIYV